MAGKPLRRSRMEALMARMGEDPRAIEQPFVPAAVRPPAPKAAPAFASEAAFDALAISLVDTLEDTEAHQAFVELRRQAMCHALAVMQIELDPADKNFAKLLGTKTAIMQAVFTATARIRPADFRDRDDDGVKELLELVKRAGVPDGPPLGFEPLTAEEMLN